MTEAAIMGNVPGELMDENPEIRYAINKTNRLKVNISQVKKFSPTRSFRLSFMASGMEGPCVSRGLPNL